MLLNWLWVEGLGCLLVGRHKFRVRKISSSMTEARVYLRGTLPDHLSGFIFSDLTLLFLVLLPSQPCTTLIPK